MASAASRGLTDACTKDSEQRIGGKASAWNRSSDGKVLKCGRWRDDMGFVESQPVPRRLLPVDTNHLAAAMKQAGSDIVLLTPDGGFYSGGVNADS